MTEAKTLAARLRERARFDTAIDPLKLLVEAADYLDRLSAPEGVGLTRYSWAFSAPIEMVHGEWVRYADAAAVIAAEKARADEAEERVEELETDAGRVSAEFEGDLWKAIRHVVESNPGFSWRDYEPEGMTADDVATLFSEDMAAAWADVERFKAKAEAAEAERDALKAALATFRKLVKEGGVPRYTVLPGAALNALVEEIDAALSKAQGGG